jgi:glycosyltransferase involved in cell wall biosynthesis
MKFLILYEELAGYFLACTDGLISQGHHVVVLHKEVNSEAPFIFNNFKAELILRESIDLDQLMSENTFDGIFCCGWIYKPYLNLCLKWKGKIPIALGFDNWWTGSLKQRLLTTLSKKFFQKRFDKCFVAGNKQQDFALKLGFNKSDVTLGVYCCDYPNFSGISPGRQEQKPKILIYTGRYVEHKGLKELWSAFIKLNDQDKLNDWELWCIGTGPLSAIDHPKIKHLGFMQPSDLKETLKNAAAFILPSKFEPWGVVLHEMAASGLPLLSSIQVGASELFMENGKNGWLFDPIDEYSLLSALENLFSCSEEELDRLGKHSYELSQRITIDKWVMNFLALFEK